MKTSKNLIAWILASRGGETLTKRVCLAGHGDKGVGVASGASEGTRTL